MRDGEAMNYDEIIGKLVVIQFVRPDKGRIRTITRLVSADENEVYVESPTKHIRSYIRRSWIEEVRELSPDEIKPGLIK